MAKVTFLSDSGKVLASSERSVSMNFQKIDQALHIFSHKVNVFFFICV